MSQYKGDLSGIKPPSESEVVPDFYYTKDYVKGPNIDIGDYTYGRPAIRYKVGDVKLKIGKFCSIAGSVQIFLGGDHRKDYVSTYPFCALKDIWPGAEGECPAIGDDVEIGNDVWIGTQTIILSGTKIEDGAIIGARSVVGGTVPAYSIFAGNTAREVGKRFDDETIKMLLDVKWWDWDIEKIKRNASILSSVDIKKIKDCK